MPAASVSVVQSQQYKIQLPQSLTTKQMAPKFGSMTYWQKISLKSLESK
jgi:hypothetical protein